MNQASLKKRKNCDSPSEDEINSSKRRKIEDIIVKTSSKEKRLNKDNRDKCDRRRSKLLTAVHLKKRYKYYCKKHDVTFLIENVRQKGREFSKENRNKLVQSFRSLEVGIHICDPLKDRSLASVSLDEKDIVDMQKYREGKNIASSSKYRHLKFWLPQDLRAIKILLYHQIESVYLHENDIDMKENSFKKPEVQSSPKVNKNLIKNVTCKKFRKNETLTGSSEAKSNEYLNHSVEDVDTDWSELLSPIRRVLINRPERYVTDEDSGYSINLEESWHTNEKTMEGFIVRKQLGAENFSDSDDCTDNDFNDEGCDCDYHSELENRFLGYDSESDDDFEFNSLFTG